MAYGSWLMDGKISETGLDGYSHSLVDLHDVVKSDFCANPDG
jgi:hypothetical protein